MDHATAQRLGRVLDAHAVRLPLPAPSHSRLAPRNTLQPPAGGAASRSLPLHTHVETVLRPMDLRVRHVASSGCMAAPTWFLIGNYAPAPAVSEKRRLRDPFLTLFLLCRSRYDEAEKELLEALAKDSKDADTLANLVVVTLHLGKPSSRYLNQLKASDPNHASLKRTAQFEEAFDRAAQGFSI
jgi:hypothetical protein